MVPAGAQITLFSMGVFNPSGNPLAPTTNRNWADGIDVDLGRLVSGEMSFADSLEAIKEAVIRTAEGKPSMTEAGGGG
jgi:altronate dehydratase large subunit